MINTRHMTAGQYLTFWSDIGRLLPDSAAEGLTGDVDFLERIRAIRIYKSDDWDVVPGLIARADAILARREIEKLVGDASFELATPAV